MQIFLLQDVKGLGKRGEVKNASDGYARNYLIPKGFAKAATEGEKKSVTKQIEEKNVRGLELKKILENLRVQTEINPISIFIRVGKKGEIFSAVKTLDVKKALALYTPALTKQAEVEIKKPIKGIGRHEVSINLGGGVRDTFTIEVNPST